MLNLCLDFYFKKTLIQNLPRNTYVDEVYHIWHLARPTYSILRDIHIMRIQIL